MKKRSIWDVLVWVAFIIVVLYLFLKLTGVIHSPLSFDIVALISGAYFVGRYTKKLDDVFGDIKKIKVHMKRISKDCPIFKEKRTKTK